MKKTVVENRDSSNVDFVDKVTLINVKRTMENIVQSSAVLKEMLDNDEILLVGGVHDISSGEVTFYSNET